MFVCVSGVSGYHLAHVGLRYLDSSNAKANDRVRETLTRAGCSIFFGGLGVLLACVFLFISTVAIVRNFVIILFMTNAFSMTSALLIFPAVLYRIGPSGNTGLLGLVFFFRTGPCDFWLSLGLLDRPLRLPAIPWVAPSVDV